MPSGLSREHTQRKLIMVLATRPAVLLCICLIFIITTRPVLAHPPNSGTTYSYGGHNFYADAQLASPPHEGGFPPDEGVLIASTGAVPHRVSVTGGLAHQVTVSYNMVLKFDFGTTPNNASKSASGTVIETDGITGYWQEWANLYDIVFPLSGYHVASAEATITTPGSSSPGYVYHDHIFLQF